MNCPDFARLRDEKFDARAAMSPGLDFDAHAATCPSCRSTAVGYHLLGQALANWPPPPPASAESLARLRLLRVPEARPSWPSRHRKALTGLASAASILALAWIGHSAWKGPVRHDGRNLAFAPSPAPRPIPSRPLDAALADATRATVELALAASGPAARIGREALDFQDFCPSPAGSEEPPKAEPLAGPTRLLEAVGERVNAGVRPISGSARHAFSFLLPPVSAPPPTDPDSRNTL